MMFGEWDDWMSERGRIYTLEVRGAACVYFAGVQAGV